MGLFSKKSDEEILDEAVQLYHKGQWAKAVMKLDDLAYRGNVDALITLAHIYIEVAEKTGRNENMDIAKGYLEKAMLSGDKNSIELYNQYFGNENTVNKQEVPTQNNNKENKEVHTINHSPLFRQYVMSKWSSMYYRNREPQVMKNGWTSSQKRLFQKLNIQIDVNDIIMFYTDTVKFKTIWFVLTFDKYLDHSGTCVEFIGLNSYEFDKNTNNLTLYYDDNTSKTVQTIPHCKDLIGWIQIIINAYVSLNEKADELFNLGKYDEAYQYYKECAVNNRLAIAQYNMGYCYECGYAVEKNMDEAIAWYTLAHNQGLIISSCNLGLIYRDMKEYEKAISYLEIAAEKDDSTALNTLGIMYAQGNGVEKNNKTAKYYYKKAAELDNVYAMYNLGGLYNRERFYFESFECYEKAYKKGHVNSKYTLGLCYLHGRGVVANYKKAVSLFEEAIASKAASGYYGLGLYYYYIENNIDKALEYFNQSITQGYQWSYGILGIIYREGLYVKEDFAKAIEYFEKAIEKGDDSMLCHLGVMYRDSIGVPKNTDKAIALFNSAIEKGKKEGYACLAHMYALGHGVKQDKEKARELFEKTEDEYNDFAEYEYACACIDADLEDNNNAILYVSKLYNFSISHMAKKKILEYVHSGLLPITSLNVQDIMDIAEKFNDTDIQETIRADKRFRRRFAPKVEEKKEETVDANIYQQALRLESKGKYKEAMELYEKYVKAYPNSLEALRKLGFAYRYGISNEVDYKKAYRYLHRYIHAIGYRFDKEAEFLYHEMRFAGWGCEKDYYSGFHMYENMLDDADCYDSFVKLTVENKEHIKSLEFAKLAYGFIEDYFDENGNSIDEYNPYTKEQYLQLKELADCSKGKAIYENAVRELKPLGTYDSYRSKAFRDIEKYRTIFKEELEQNRQEFNSKFEKPFYQLFEAADKGYTPAIKYIFDNYYEEYEYLTDETLVHYFIKTLEAYNNEEYVKLEYFDENGILTKAKMYLVNEYFSDCIYALRKLVMSYEEGSCLFEEAIKLVFSCLKYEFPSLDNNYKQVLKDYYYKNKEKLAEKRIIINEDYFDNKNEPHYVYLEFPVLNPCNMDLKDVAKNAKVSLTFKNKRAMNKNDFSRIDAKYLDLNKGDTLKIKARFHTGECDEDLYDYIKLLDDDRVFERAKDKDGYFDEGDNTLIGLTYISHEGDHYEFEDVFKERFIFNRSDLVFMPSYMDEDSLLYLYVRNGVPQLIVKVTDEDRML